MPPATAEAQQPLPRWWTLAQANSDSWHPSSSPLPSDSSHRSDLACLLEDPSDWQQAQVPVLLLAFILTHRCSRPGLYLTVYYKLPIVTQ